MAKPASTHIAVKLELTLEEFGAFVAILRGEVLNPEVLASLTARLNQKSAALLAAEEGASDAESRPR